MAALLHALVEGHRQPSRWIVDAGQSLGDGSSALFSRVPGFENCIRVFLRPIHRECAAVHEHHHQRLARPQSSEKRLLLFRQIKVGAITALKSGHLDFHLFAFEFGRDSNHRDHRVCLLGCRDRIPDGVHKGSQPDQFDASSACGRTQFSMHTAAPFPIPGWMLWASGRAIRNRLRLVCCRARGEFIDPVSPMR